ncbi:MAG: bifunctional acetate--CoA ligase family protein/GNAT family N-acetyltransferase [Parachlamydiales bacterium]|jgi:acetyltransferase
MNDESKLLSSPKDPSQNFMEHLPLPLDAFFQPKSVAVVGAKDDVGSVGRTMMANLLSGGFDGEIYPVNPKRSEVLGKKSYPTVKSIPAQVDLAVIITPASTVPKVLEECAEAGIKAVIIISAGFKELGDAGLALENQVLEIASRKGIRIIGPNCLGVMNPVYGLNATFAKGIAQPGNIAFISQSGAMCTAVLDWSFEERVGFSAFVSIGSMADVDWGDLISYLGAQSSTRSILIYMETIGDPRSFLSAAREIALEKPIIVIKPGRSAQAAHAAASHTGSLAGSDEVFDAALERVGVLRVNTISELFSMASVLAKQPKPKGPRLSLVTNAGGPAVLATDATVISGAELAVLNPKTISALDKFLPVAWSHGNPVDILGDARPERYSKTMEILINDDATDGILVILSPQDVTDPIGTAECLRHYGKGSAKPILASWMGGASVRPGAEMLNKSGIPSFEYPDEAAWTFATMWRYSDHLKTLYEVPALRNTEIKDEARNAVKAIIDKARQEKRTLLNEYESKNILELYKIPCVETRIAKNVQEAVEAARTMPFPYVVKLFSHTITHKTEVGGVKLNLKSEKEVEEAFNAILQSVTEKVGKEHFEGVTVQRMIPRDGYEIILGSSTDAQFGPVLLFGTGGQLVEVYKDSALGLPPLNTNLARQLMAKTKIYEALKGVRGRKSADMPLLEKVLVSFSQLVVEHKWIKECDINPLLIGPEHLIAVDARILLHDCEEKDIPALAIRPYPIEYISKAKLKNGTEVLIRPIRPEDEPAMVVFHRELSENSVRQRYFEFISLDKRVAHQRLSRICFTDYDREIALVAEMEHHKQGSLSIIMGFARISRLANREEAELKMIIADAYHNKGLGNLFITRLLEVAKQENIKRVFALVLSENEGMIHLCQKKGFKRIPHPDPLLTNLVCNL